MWIDRIISESPDGPVVSDLHERLTVIASADQQRRREAFVRVANALRVVPGSTMEVRTEYGETVSAHRTAEDTALFDTRSKLPVHTTDSSLGIVASLNDPNQMRSYIELFHVGPESLKARVQQDAQLIHLAQTPLDQLFSLANDISTAEDALAKVQDDRSNLSESRRERESREQSLHEEMQANDEVKQKDSIYSAVAILFLIAGLAIAILVALPVGLGVLLLGIVVALLGKRIGAKANFGETDAQALDLQLGRVDELFDTQNITRNRRHAEEELAQRRAQWHAIAGDAEPAVLIKDRPRIEELASHLQLISHAQGETPGDTSVLVGFASLLAELARRFPAERVPLLIDDPFESVAAEYHLALRELILRASHRRQVILETSDLETTKWAAVEAVGSNAIVITDYDIETDRIIDEAVSAEDSQTV